METDRRSARRKVVNLFCNQYIDGMPSLAETIELSMTGALVRRVLGPGHDRSTYAFEIPIPGSDTRVWLVAVPVWRLGTYEAVRFVMQSGADRLRLATLLDQAAPDLSFDTDGAN